jgi:hypothetical protein
MAIIAPFGGPPKLADLQGKSSWGSGSAPFGVQNGLVWLFAAGRSTATTGARPFGHITGVGLPGGPTKR